MKTYPLALLGEISMAHSSAIMRESNNLTNDDNELIVTYMGAPLETYRITVEQMCWGYMLNVLVSFINDVRGDWFKMNVPIDGTLTETEVRFAESSFSVEVSLIGEFTANVIRVPLYLEVKQWS